MFAKSVTKNTKKALFEKGVSVLCGTALCFLSAQPFSLANAQNSAVASSKKAPEVKRSGSSYDDTLYMEGCRVSAWDSYYAHVPENAETYAVISDIDAPFMSEVIMPMPNGYADMFDVRAYMDISGQGGSEYSKKVLIAKDVRPGEVCELPIGTYGVEISAYDNEGYPVKMGEGASVGFVFKTSGLFSGTREWTEQYNRNHEEDNTIEPCFISAAKRLDVPGEVIYNSLKKIVKQALKL